MVVPDVPMPYLIEPLVPPALMIRKIAFPLSSLKRISLEHSAVETSPGAQSRVKYTLASVVAVKVLTEDLVPEPEPVTCKHLFPEPSVTADVVAFPANPQVLPSSKSEPVTRWYSLRFTVPTFPAKENGALVRTSPNTSSSDRSFFILFNLIPPTPLIHFFENPPFRINQ
jgi:hypothetical protein